MVDLVVIEQMSKKEIFKVLLFLFPFFLEGNFANFVVNVMAGLT